MGKNGYGRWWNFITLMLLKLLIGIMHASQYLYKIADETFETKSEEYKTWIDRMKTLLWDGRIDILIAECECFTEKPAVSKVANALLPSTPTMKNA